SWFDLFQVSRQLAAAELRFLCENLAPIRRRTLKITRALRLHAGPVKRGQVGILWGRPRSRRDKHHFLGLITQDSGLRRRQHLEGARWLAEGLRRRLDGIECSKQLTQGWLEGALKVDVL